MSDPSRRWTAQALGVRPWRLAGRSGLAVLAIAAALVLLHHAAAARATDAALLADARDGRLDQFDLSTAALVASGVEQPAALRQCVADYQRRRQLTLREAETASDRLAALHAALHRRFLTGSYRADASDLAATLRGGDYNCLTAVVLFVDLCREAQLDVSAWQRPGHVGVMTADNRWIEPGEPDWLKACRPCRAPAAESPRAAAERPLSPLALVGKFYYNRGVEQLRQQRYAAGLALLRHSLVCDPEDADARDNLAAGLNNWAVERYRAADYARAATLIEQGLAASPQFAPLLVNRRLLQSRLGQ